MAELILSPIAKRIIDELGSAAVKEIGLLWGVNKELDELEDTISTIKAVLLDAEEKQLHNHQARNWLKRLGAAVHEADDLSDEINTEALRRQAMSGSNLVKKVRTFFSASNQLAFRHKMGRRIEGIKKKLAAISNDRNFLLEVRHDENREVIARKRRETHSFVRQEEVIGRDKDRMAIVKLLLEGEFKDNVTVIPIVGMGGLGKTTLAQCVYNDEKVNEHFELKIWVCVSDDFDLKLIVETILKSSNSYNNVGENELLDQMQKDLRNVLGGKRYLLVLDDVWIEDHEKWRQLKDLLVSTGLKGSRVIVITRSKTVAQITGPMQLYQLGILDAEKSWILFRMVACEEGEEPQNASIVDIGKTIVKKCGGIPLAIRAIGSMLGSRNLDLEYWSFIDKEFSRISHQKEEKILQTLKLSYDHLPPHLKHCFAYCSLFQKDYEIRVQELIKLWMAQDFLRDSDHQCPEEVGYVYLMDLVERSFLQEVEIDIWGTLRCKMHDLMHDLAMQVAGTECVRLSNSSGLVDKSIHHVSYDKFYVSTQIQNLSVQESRIRTIIRSALHPIIEGQEDDPTSNAVISNFGFLRTLDLSYSINTVLSNSIAKLKHLRYLDLSWNLYIKRLPNSITNLLNLQTLKLNYCHKLRELPKDLKRLVNLRNLEIAGPNKLTHMPCGMGYLINLQSLSNYVLCEKGSFVSGELKELRELNNLRGELEISNLRPGKEAAKGAEYANLKAKQHLQSLTLKWNYDVDTDETETTIGYEKSLEGLQPQPNLQALSLDFYYQFSKLASISNKFGFVIFTVMQEMPASSSIESIPPSKGIKTPELAITRVHIQQ